MTLLRPTPPVKFEPVSRPDPDIDRPHRSSNFAREMMLAEFGKLGHLCDEQWADHDDISAEQLAQKRKQVLWSGVAS